MEVSLFLYMILLSATGLEIQDLSNNSGILPLRLGPARIITGYNSLIHIIDTESYERNVQKISDNLDMIQYHGTAIDTLEVTKFKLADLRRKIYSLVPLRRSKRGLINGLGSMVKIITGNMDANDAEKINEQIRQLSKGHNNVGTTVSALNFEMMQRFDNLTTHINNEQNSIAKYISDNMNSIKSNTDLITDIQHLNRINYNIDILSIHVSDIIESITLAKINIISRQILNPVEMKQILYYFDNQSISVNSEDHVYELLGLQAYYNGTNIIFNVRIPIFSHDPYKLYRIIPLPVNNTLQISTKPYIAYNEKSIQYYDLICPEIEGMFYCLESIYRDETIRSTCIGNLMRNKTAHCPLDDVGNVETFFQPEPNFIVFMNIINTTFTCRNESFSIQGTGVLHYDKCTIDINGTIFVDNENKFWDEVYLLPPPTATLTTNFTRNNITLQKLELFTHQTLKKQNLGYVVISLCIIATVVLTCILPKRKIVQFITSSPANAPAQSFWPSLYSKGGGVTA